MNIIFAEDGSVRMEDIDEFAAMLLREMPGIASSDDERAEGRIYQSPTDGKDEQADSEWKDAVEPELRELFSSAIDMVVDDLATMKPNEQGELNLAISASHVDPWMHTLNRARLVLGAEWDISETDMTSSYVSPTGDPERTMAVLKIDFYGTLLEFFVRMKWKS